MAACLLLANSLSSKYGSTDSKNWSKSAGSADMAGSSDRAKEDSLVDVESVFHSVSLARWRLTILECLSINIMSDKLLVLYRQF
jgi:hypothetical protein